MVYDRFHGCVTLWVFKVSTAGWGGSSIDWLVTVQCEQCMRSRTSARCGRSIRNEEMRQSECTVVCEGILGQPTDILMDTTAAAEIGQGGGGWYTGHSALWEWPL